MLRAQCKVGTLGPTYAVFDRYYGSGHFISSLLQKETQVIVRLRGNSVARLPAAKNSKGRRAKYGSAIGATTLALDYPHRWVADPFDSSEQVHVSTFVAYWRPLRRMVRWVVGKSSRYKQPLVLISTDVDLTADEMLSTYAAWFKIEVMFRAFKHVILGFGYRFWTLAATPAKRVPHDTYLRRKTPSPDRR
jgi:hypothetical protein